MTEHPNEVPKHTYKTHLSNAWMFMFPCAASLLHQHFLPCAVGGRRGEAVSMSHCTAPLS